MSVTGLGPLAATRRGVVARFDEAVGLGAVTEADGTERAFHCTAIVDGSRTIAVGAEVFYRLRAGVAGIEASEVATPAMLAASTRFRDEAGA